MICTVLFQPEGISIQVPSGTTLQQAQLRAGLQPDAPCGGRGTCGKCAVVLEDGRKVLACRTIVRENMTVFSARQPHEQILLQGKFHLPLQPDGTDDYAIAFDIGTTTVVGYLLDGHSGTVLARQGIQNPQRQYGADVISRIQNARTDGAQLQRLITDALSSLTEKLAAQVHLPPDAITAAAVAGNTAMHHLLLGIDPKPLVTPPYMPNVCQAMEADFLPISGKVRILPNIAGFIGGDTVACMLASRLDQCKELTLLVDIGTNGEMVLSNGTRTIACSAAAGPAFEGARISCGMRGEEGAIDHVYLKNGEIHFHVVGNVEPRGICGSGLLDLLAVLLDSGRMDSSGRLQEGSFRLTESVTLTQKDVREAQLAKAAIRAGITMMAQQIGAAASDIQHVLLAGAFGNYMDPLCACRIGMLPPELAGRIQPIGNAAGTGACMCALSRRAYRYASTLAAGTEFLEFAGMEEFQDCFLDCLEFA